MGSVGRTCRSFLLIVSVCRGAGFGNLLRSHCGMNWTMLVMMCSFWLVDALAHGGDLEGAQRLFERLLTFCSPLGLLSEEVNVRTGELLGNYPQAFTHLALVGAAVNIERARHRRIGVRGLRR